MTVIVVLAMVAAFLALRLYSVLGKRTGHEQTYVAPVERAPRITVSATEEPSASAPAVADSSVDVRAVNGVRAIAAADNGFDADRFIGGAKGAYREILEAFWRGDEEALRPLVSDDVFAAFADAIRTRSEAGHVLDNRLINVERAVISDASIENRQAQVTVRFDADIATVMRDGEGRMVGGSMSDAVSTHDAWTFARETKSRDPNWLLIDTDESA